MATPKLKKPAHVELLPAPADTGVDPHVQAIAARVSELRAKRGISRNALAKAADLHATHMGQFLLGKQGISLEALAKAAEALGAALLTEGDEIKPSRIGTFTPDGRVMTDLKHVVLPGFVEAAEGCEDFVAGERIHVRADNAFEVGKWVLVERKSDASRDFVKCIEVDGVRYLRTPQGDELRFVAERYRIIAKAYGGFRPM